jgi:hypothetical protein
LRLFRNQPNNFCVYPSLCSRSSLRYLETVCLPCRCARRTAFPIRWRRK